MGIFLRGKSWYYEFQVRGERYIKSLGPVTKTQAKREETAARAKALAGTLTVHAPQTSPRFGAFAPEFLTWYAAHRRPRSTARYGAALKPLMAFFGGERLDQILPLMIERYKRQRLALGIAPGTITIELTCLSALYTLAMVWGKARANPMRQVPYYRREQRHMRVLSAAEEVALLAACAPQLQGLVLTALHTGLRASELLSLRWRHVDLRQRLVTVEAAAAKSRRARTVPLSQTLTVALEAMRREQPSDGAVFLSSRGTPYRKFSPAFVHAVQRAGIPPIRFHDLRHTFASRLVQRGVNLRTVQELLGHASLTQTQIYTHIHPGQMRQAVATFDHLPTDVPYQGFYLTEAQR